MWVRHACSDTKLGLLEAYQRELSQAQKDLLSQAIVDTWAEEGNAQGRMLYRVGGDPNIPMGGMSLTTGSSHRRGARGFWVTPEEVMLDSRAPTPFVGFWAKSLNSVYPNTFDWSGKPHSFRATLSPAECRMFGTSPLWTPEYQHEEEVILHMDANPRSA